MWWCDELALLLAVCCLKSEYVFFMTVEGSAPTSSLGHGQKVTMGTNSTRFGWHGLQGVWGETEMFGEKKLVEEGC